MRPQEYRRVREEEDYDEEPRMKGNSTSSTCLLPCVLLLLILISFALALAFFVKSPWKATPFISTHAPSTTTTTRKTTTTKTTTQGPEFNDTLELNSTIFGIFNGTLGLNSTLEEEEDLLHESNSQLKHRLIQLIRHFETSMEKLTGMEGELLVPMFMLLCFLTSVSIVSLCCCMMTKRREARRRQLFGKIITDLQTGDSKTVLLNHSDLDD